MSTAHHDSALGVDAGLSPLPAGGRISDSAIDQRTIWLDGDVLACACPSCRAPMAVRVWLMTADCWRCNTSVELTEEEEQEARRLLAERELATEAPAAAPTGPAARKSARPTGRPIRAPVNGAAVDLEPPPLQPIAAPPVGAAVPDHDHDFDHNWMRDLPAWLTSLIVHLLAMIMLGLFTVPDDKLAPKMVLTVTVGKQGLEGGELAKVVLNPNEFDLPVGKPPETPQEREALVKANQDAHELRIDQAAASKFLPPLAKVKEALKSDDPYRRMHAARDPRVRAELVRREGGTTYTEAAVARALRWMSLHQNADGSWSLDRFSGAPACRGQCSGHGGLNADSGGTALVLMSLLGTGQTHRGGIYKDHVSRGLRWLIEHQDKNGDLRAGAAGHTGMYVHAQAAITLCDAFKLTGDESLRAPAQKSIEFICQAQHPAGGWRYAPGDAGDLSVVGWQLMALQCAKSAYLNVPKENMQRADAFMSTVQTDTTGGLYTYMPGGGATPTMTAEGLLSRMYLGWNKSQPGLKTGIEFLIQNHLPQANAPNIYYWYYGTQVMHHWGGDPWRSWNERVQAVLVSTQETSGHQAGSWPPTDVYGAQAGRLYTTALSACTLEVYYRYAPLYWQLELE